MMLSASTDWVQATGCLAVIAGKTVMGRELGLEACKVVKVVVDAKEVVKQGGLWRTLPYPTDSMWSPCGVQVNPRSPCGL